MYFAFGPVLRKADSRNEGSGNSAGCSGTTRFPPLHAHTPPPIARITTSKTAITRRREDGLIVQPLRNPTRFLECDPEHPDFSEPPMKNSIALGLLLLSGVAFADDKPKTEYFFKPNDRIV